MKRTLFLALVAAAPSFAAIDIDSMMSEDEKLKTGVATMTADQKMELAIWIDQNFTPKMATAPTPPPAEEKSKTLYLSENTGGGKELRLSDGSVYEISPDDRALTAFWITPFPITVKPSDDPNYPFLITNTNTGTSVKAKLLPPTKPKAPPPPPAAPNAR